MREFRMPSLGADMESGLLVEWNVKPGDKVKRGDVIAVVETQKGAVEVEIWDEGVIDQLVVAPGTKVPVGGVLALRRAEDEAPLAPYAGMPAGRGTRPAAPLPTPPPAPTGRGEKISPAARRRAAQLGLDPGRVAASGADGVVSLADVERAAAEALKPAPEDKSAAMRQAIAAAMAKSKREIPHYYLSAALDVSAAFAWLEDVIPGDEIVSSIAMLLQMGEQGVKPGEFKSAVWSEWTKLTAQNVEITMQNITFALGLRCIDCHEMNDLALDTKPQKVKARMMLEMVRDINAKFDDGKTHVTCWTCHRGAPQNTPVLVYAWVGLPNEADC